MAESKNYHMSPEEFKKHGYEVIDWIADYMQNVQDFPVQSQVSPGDIRAKLPAAAPAKGESFASIMQDVDEIIMPGITHWQSPDWFAFFPANSSGPAVLGDLLSSGLGVQGMIWDTSPAATELETHVMDWLVDMMDLPQHFKSTSTGGGVIQDTASSAALAALIAAREKKANVNDEGFSEKLTVYVSDQAHSSIEKGVKIAGFGKDNLRIIKTDENFAMLADELEAAIKADIAAGKKPCYVSATVGTTSSNGIDPLRQIGEICQRHDIWLHVDAAMSGTAALCPEFRWIHDGLELADSYCFNPHKWMFTNFDCDAFWVKDRAALIKALSILPEYLRNKATESGAVIDYRDWHVQLGRKFRSLKLWFVIRHYGIEGLQHHIRKHVEISRQFTEWIRQSDQFELFVEPPLNLVCFRLKASDEANEKLVAMLNDSGKLALSHTKLNDQYVIRMSIGQTYTELKNLENAWALMQEFATEATE
jgi:aromatic-L-amino-acid decarboxylase